MLPSHKILRMEKLISDFIETFKMGQSVFTFKPNKFHFTEYCKTIYNYEPQKKRNESRNYIYNVEVTNMQLGQIFSKFINLHLCKK